MNKITNCQLVIFDWDGTLIDSAAFIVKCVQAAAMDMGLTIPAAEFIISTIGLPLVKQIEYFFPKLDEKRHQNFINRYRQHQVTLPGKSQLFPGAYEVLQQLKNRCPQGMALATSKTRLGLNPELERCNLAHVFREIRCGDEAQPKPNPQMLLEILAATGISAEHALMVGDTEYDLQMANNAGVKSIGVGYGMHSKDRLSEYKPVTVINNINELLDWINEENNND